MSHEYFPQAVGDDRPATAREKAAVEKAIRYIHNNLDRAITLETLTQETHLSMYYFAHAFKKITGYSPIEYTQNVRLEQAKQYLADTALTLEEIAARVGYQSASALSGLFRKKLGMSPGTYRKQKKSKSKTAH